MLGSSGTGDNREVNPTGTVQVPPVEKVNVLLVGMRGILGEIVREIVADQPDMEIAGELQDLGELRSSRRLGRSRVVIACRDDESELRVALSDLLSHEDIRDLLGRHPGLTLLTVQGDGRHGSVYRLRPEKIPLGDVSPGALVDAIRAPTTEWSSGRPLAMSCRKTAT